jgi:Ca-activated chloride channel family protein
VRKYSKRYDLYQPLAMLAVITMLLELLLRATVYRRLP